MLICIKLPVYLLLVAPILLRAHDHDYHESEEQALPQQHSVINHISPLTSLATRGSFSRSYSRRGRDSSSNSNSVSNVNPTSNFSASINQIPRAPVWNGAPSEQQQIDFNQLHAIMGEPRGSSGTGSGRGLRLSELITRPKPRCNRRIRVLNGVTRIRERGSLARFQCSHGFTLIGPTTTVCLRDRWSEPPPICVKGGCRPLQRPQNAEVRYSVGGAVAGFYCNANSKLIGDPVIFCDGIKWNGTEPTCYIEPTPTTTPEPDSEEVWPASVATPATLNASMENDDQESHWDNYVSPSIQEASTVLPVIEISTTPEMVQTTLANENSATTALNIPVTTEPPPKPVEQTINAVTEIVHHQESPEQEKITEKHHEVPAPITTAQPAIHTQEMGQTEKSPHHPITPVLALQTTVAPLPPSPILPKFTSPPIIDIPVTANISRPNIINTISTSLTTAAAPEPITTAPPQPIPLTTSPPRRFKIITRRPRTRRPFTTRRSARRPFRRRTTTTTTTMKPRRRKIPTRRPFQIFTTVYPVESGNDWDSPAAPTSADYAIAIDRAFLPREQVEPIRPIYPDMLNNNHEGGHVGHASMIVGIMLIVVGLSTFSAGVVFYCWRKNKGIARARPYDMDGRTLSAHDANDDFMWMEQRDSGL